MRRLTTGLSATSTLILLLASSPTAAAKQRAQGPIDAIQPTESRTRLVLLSRPGGARVESTEGRRRVRLNGDERLTTISETGSGWIAGGVSHTEELSSVFFVAERYGVADRLPRIPQRARLQLLPVLLVQDGDLRGAAWLEGKSQRQLAVRFAEWTGIDWGPVTTISPPGPGSQTGLTGLALRDGELLLAWSRFDGTDDELYWSWRRGSAWSRANRVGEDNKTPDITPALARTGRGATLVWARMHDGEYRLQSREFRSGHWRPEHVIGGRGSLFPTLVRQSDHLLVLYRTAAPRGWSLAELGNRALPLRHAHAADISGLRPLVTTPTGTGPVLQWRRPKRSAMLRWELER